MCPVAANGNQMPDVAIVGAGIVGICAAAYLAEAGHKVTVFDRTGVCEETSSGNASAFAFSDVLPLAHKGMLKNLPRWLAGRTGNRAKLAGIVIGRQERTSAKGNRFAFVQLSDTSGMFEALVFSETLSTSRELLEPGHRVLAAGSRPPRRPRRDP